MQVEVLNLKSPRDPLVLNSLSGWWGHDELCYAIKRVQHKWFHFKVGFWVELCCVLIRWVKSNWKWAAGFRKSSSLSAFFSPILCAQVEVRRRLLAFFSFGIYRSCGSGCGCLTSIFVAPNIRPQATVRVRVCHVEKCWLIDLIETFCQFWLIMDKTLIRLQTVFQNSIGQKNIWEPLLHTLSIIECMKHITLCFCFL